MILDRLRRITRDGRWIPEIDGLRFLAITSVFLFHVLGEVGTRSGRVIPVEHEWLWLVLLLGNGDRGMRLFFVISGMILALPYARHFLLGSKPVSLKKYYLRRLTRLEPPYIVATLLAFVMFAAYLHGVGQGLVMNALASLFYQHNLIFGTIPLNLVTWSLEVEVQYYILAPLLMQVYRIKGKLPRRILLSAGVIAIGCVQLPFHGNARFAISILYYLQYFLAGLLVADIFVLDLDTMRSSWMWDGAGTLALLAMYTATHEANWAHILMPIPMALLCISVMRSLALRRFFANQWIAVIGGMCYSIYLLHFLLIAVFFKVTKHLLLPHAIFFVNYGIQLVLLTIPVFAICAAFFIFIERPCMDPNWPSKLWHAVTGRRESEAVALDSGQVLE